MMQVGDRVRIERDEVRYPSKGTWPQFRGRVGTIVEVNRDRKPHLAEFGVTFSKARLTGGGQSSPVTWFKRYEMAAAVPESDADGRTHLYAVGGA